EARWRRPMWASAKVQASPTRSPKGPKGKARCRPGAGPRSARSRAGRQRSPGFPARRLVNSSGISSVAAMTCRLTRFGVPQPTRPRNPRQEPGGYDSRGPSSAVVPPMSEATRILSAIEQGDPSAAAQLLPLVYDELRRLAAQQLAQEKPGQTLQPTALVHEAYLRLVGAGAEQAWDSRGHFFAAAAEAMRRVLIDNARRKQADKHGGGWQRH